MTNGHLMHELSGKAVLFTPTSTYVMPLALYREFEAYAKDLESVPRIVEVCKRDYAAIWEALAADMRFMSRHEAVSDRQNLVMPGTGIVFVWKKEEEAT